MKAEDGRFPARSTSWSFTADTFSRTWPGFAARTAAHIGDEATYHWEGDNFNPFRDQEHYIILNLAIGGTEGGDPFEAEFPIRYEVDYVRVYAR